MFNPFTLKDCYKPLKEEPAKWTLKHALRALVNHQYIDFKCDGYYTDDYAYDNAVNFQQGPISNVIAFAKKVIENKSGWKAYKSSYDNRININCYYFDTNSFKLKIA